MAVPSAAIEANSDVQVKVRDSSDLASPGWRSTATGIKWSITQQFQLSMSSHLYSVRRATVDEDEHYSFAVTLWCRSPWRPLIGKSATARDFALRLMGGCLPDFAGWSGYPR